MRTRTLWLILTLALLMVATTGCFQSAGDGDAATLVSLPLPSNTPEPTNTEEPATATPTPDPDFDEDDDSGAQIAQDVTVDPLILEATQTVIASKQEVISLTQTAEAEFSNLPTETPTTDFFEPATATPTESFQQQPPLGADCIHEVRAGQNLYRLSLLYGVSINDIMVASGIVNMNLILPGQRLRIPNCGTTGVVPPPTSTPRPGAALPPDPQPGAGLGISPATGGVLCGISPTDPNGGFWPSCLGGYGGVTSATGTTGTTIQAAPPASAGGVQHTVQAGESVFAIAQRYGVSPDSIIAANGLNSEGAILVGQVLTIP
jgi:LysM repeat protein